MTDFSNSHNISIQNLLSQIKTSHRFNQVELGALQKPLTIDFYEKWLGQKYHGQMEYLEKHLPFKKNPQLLDGKITSVISVAQAYFPAVKAHPLKIPARTALYAKNEDYHYWLKEKLQSAIQTLREHYPQALFLPYVDSGPLLERDLAYQNGLGWFGKNTCLIHPQHGSLFFIAEILTDLKPETETQLEPLPDFCGKCQKCIEICPTQALTSPRTLKADQCISYLTIEAKTPAPLELRSQIGDWFFGCDLCQTVCPWNEKVFRTQSIEKTELTSTELQLALSPEQKNELIGYFRMLLTSSYKKIQKYHLGSPLSRAGAKGLIRNALVVIANKKMLELKNEVALLIEKPDWHELAGWCVEQLES
ncbi:MAG: tRNA epoxyqueuosine(34) reductase QueG [Pseudobdellovibrio sp.]